MNFRLSRIGQCRLEVYAVVFMGFVMQKCTCLCSENLAMGGFTLDDWFFDTCHRHCLVALCTDWTFGAADSSCFLWCFVGGLSSWRRRLSSPWRQKIAGFTIFFFGILTLMWTSVTATTIAYDYVTQPAFSFAFSRFDLVLSVLGWLTSVASITLSFTLKSSWSTRRCLFWEMVAWVVPAVSLLFFWILFLTGQTLEA